MQLINAASSSWIPGSKQQLKLYFATKLKLNLNGNGEQLMEAGGQPDSSGVDGLTDR